MADVEFTLKNKVISEATGMLYVNDADVKFKFTVDGITHVPAKKANLMVLSPVFKAMFSGDTRQHCDVTVDATIDAFKEFLQFFHLADVKLTMGNMNEVARLAKVYDIFAHVNSCLEEFRTELTFENVCWAYQLSIFFDNHRMKKSCENYITVFTKEILASVAFYRCDKDVLKNILQLKSMAYTNSDLMKNCFKWAQKACRRVGINENHMGNLLQLLDECVGTDDSNDVERMDSSVFYDISRNVKDLENLMFDRRSTLDKLIHKKRSNPFSDRDKPHILADDSPWFSTFSYFEFEAPSPIARSLSVINQAHFSMSHPVLLRDIELKHFHCKDTNRQDYNLKLMVKILEYSDLSFKENDNNRSTIVFEKSVKIRISTNRLENTSISPCIFINPRKMYKFTWQVTSGNEWFQINTLYYDIKTNTSNWTDGNLKLKLHHEDGLDYNQSGIMRKLTFRHLYDLRW